MAPRVPVRRATQVLKRTMNLVCSKYRLQPCYIKSSHMHVCSKCWEKLGHRQNQQRYRRSNNQAQGWGILARLPLPWPPWRKAASATRGPCKRAPGPGADGLLRRQVISTIAVVRTSWPTHLEFAFIGGGRHCISARRHQLAR